MDDVELDRSVLELIELMEAGNQVSAMRYINSFQDAGHSGPEVLDLIRATQHEVGRRWEDRRWTIAMERMATAVSEAAVGALLFDAPYPLNGPRVAVASVEGERHVLPAKILAAQLTHLGHRVVFIPADGTGHDLALTLRNRSVDAIMLSCTRSATLPNALLNIEQLHAQGMAVIVGGYAFGPDARRAVRLGADAWADTAEGASAIAAEWAREPLTELAVATVPIELRRRLLEALPSVLHTLDATVGDVFAIAEQAARRDHVHQLVHDAHAALIVDDETLLVDAIEWIRATEQHRGPVAASTREVIELVADAFLFHDLDECADAVSRVAEKLAIV